MANTFPSVGVMAFVTRGHGSAEERAATAAAKLPVHASKDLGASEDQRAEKTSPRRRRRETRNYNNRGKATKIKSERLRVAMAKLKSGRK